MASTRLVRRPHCGVDADCVSYICSAFSLTTCTVQQCHQTSMCLFEFQDLSLLVTLHLISSSQPANRGKMEEGFTVNSAWRALRQDRGNYFFILGLPFVRIFKWEREREIERDLLLWTRFLITVPNSQRSRTMAPRNFKHLIFPLIITGHKISTVALLVSRFSLALAISIDSIKSLNV